MRRWLVLALIALGVTVAHAGPYFDSTECPTNVDGSPVNANHMTCHQFETGWYYIGTSPTGPGSIPNNNGWTGVNEQPTSGIIPAGAYRCGAGTAIFGNCSATGGPQSQGTNVGSRNIAHHWFWTPTCHSYTEPYYPGADCTVAEFYARWYVYWDFTAFGNTKFITIANIDSVDLAFPALFGNDGGVSGPTTNGELTINLNYCNAFDSAYGTGLVSGCEGTPGIATWDASSAAQGLTNFNNARHILTLLRNHVYFMEIHMVTDSKTGVPGSGVYQVWVNDCGTTKPLPAGACGASPTLRRNFTNVIIDGNSHGNKPTNILFDFWTFYGNTGEGPFMDNLVVSRSGPIGFTDSTSTAPAAPTNLHFGAE